MAGGITIDGATPDANQGAFGLQVGRRWIRP
jgi:hypothetical protein